MGGREGMSDDNSEVSAMRAALVALAEAFGVLAGSPPPSNGAVAAALRARLVRLEAIGRGPDELAPRERVALVWLALAGDVEPIAPGRWKLTPAAHARIAAETERKHDHATATLDQVKKVNAQLDAEDREQLLGRPARGR